MRAGGAADFSSANLHEAASVVLSARPPAKKSAPVVGFSSSGHDKMAALVSFESSPAEKLAPRAIFETGPKEKLAPMVVPAARAGQFVTPRAGFSASDLRKLAPLVARESTTGENLASKVVGDAYLFSAAAFLASPFFAAYSSTSSRLTGSPALTSISRSTLSSMAGR